MPWIEGGCVTDFGRQIGPEQAIVAFCRRAFDYSSHPDQPGQSPCTAGYFGASLVSYRALQGWTEDEGILTRHSTQHTLHHVANTDAYDGCFLCPKARPHPPAPRGKRVGGRGSGMAGVRRLPRKP